MSRIILERAGYEVLTAEDGPDALAQFRAAPDRVAVVVLDVNIPGFNGWEVLAELRRLRPGVRVVMTSGNGSEAMEAAVEWDEPTAVLLKPFLPADLTAVVTRVLGAP
jgi:CheY-like chemotaxis protein